MKRERYASRIYELMCRSDKLISHNHDCSVPSHYLKECWHIVVWSLKNQLHWNFIRNSIIFIQENAFKMLSAKWRPFCLGLIVLWFKPVRTGSRHSPDRNLGVCRRNVPTGGSAAVLSGVCHPDDDRDLFPSQMGVSAISPWTLRYLPIYPCSEIDLKSRCM